MNSIYRILEWVSIGAFFINVVFGIIMPLIKMKQAVNNEKKKLLHKILYALFLCVAILFAFFVFRILSDFPDGSSVLNG